MTIDIFCDVIDNFGDTGVCWRLASIFSCEHGFPVKLYINDAETLSKITAGLDPKKLPCLVQGVEIHDWKDAETSEMCIRDRFNLVLSLELLLLGI